MVQTACSIFVGCFLVLAYSGRKIRAKTSAGNPIWQDNPVKQVLRFRGVGNEAVPHPRQHDDGKVGGSGNLGDVPA